MADDFRPLGVGDFVKVLRACKLPQEDVLGVGVIERVSGSHATGLLYWVRGFETAKAARVLRRTKTLADVYAEHDEREIAHD